MELILILRNYCVFILDLQYIYQIIEFKIQKEQKKIKNCDEISKLIKAFPKDIAALDKRIVLAKVNSQGSGR